MPMRNPIAAGLSLVMVVLFTTGCAHDAEFEKAWPEKLHGATARLKQNSTQDELDAYAFLLMEGRSIKYDAKMTGETAAAIAAAYSQFMALGLAERQDEMSVRLVAVARKSIDGKGYYIVQFEPRYMPTSKLPQSPGEPWGVPHWFYPVSTYWFYIRDSDFSFEKYELKSD